MEKRNQRQPARKRGSPSLIANYKLLPGVPDEMIGPTGAIRPSWESLIAALDELGDDGSRGIPQQVRVAAVADARDAAEGARLGSRGCDRGEGGDEGRGRGVVGAAERPVLLDAAALCALRPLDVPALVGAAGAPPHGIAGAAEREAFVKATRPVYDKWKQQVGADLVTAAEKAIAARKQ